MVFLGRMNDRKRSPSYFFRLSGFAFIAILLIFILLDILFAGVFMAGLTSPPCQSPGPSPIGSTEYWLATLDGIQTRVWYQPSQNGAAVIVLGGTSGALSSRVPAAEILRDAGFGVVQIDTRACAEPKTKVTLGANETYDAQAALDFLLDEISIPAEKIGIYGFSMGGAAAIRSTAVRDEIRAVIAEGGYADLSSQILGFGQRLTLLDWIVLPPLEWAYHLYTGIDPAEISPIESIAEIQPRPLLLIYGELEIENGRGFEQFQAAGEPKEIWVVPGGSHGKNYAVAPKEYEERIIWFFKDALDVE